MLRYITGVSLITIVLLIVRRLAKGRMLNRHRYALWLLIPIYMLVAPFLKINVTVAEEFSNIIPRAVRTVSYYEPEAEIQSDMDISEDVLQEVCPEELRLSLLVALAQPTLGKRRGSELYLFL
jgi:beta-lactamase regulating signal transducer with metallopeptidase domain